jgi:hypothetical protein
MLVLNVADGSTHRVAPRRKRIVWLGRLVADCGLLCGDSERNCHFELGLLGSWFYLRFVCFSELWVEPAPALVRGGILEFLLFLDPHQALRSNWVAIFNQEDHGHDWSRAIYIPQTASPASRTTNT